MDDAHNPYAAPEAEVHFVPPDSETTNLYLSSRWKRLGGWILDIILGILICVPGITIAVIGLATQLVPIAIIGFLIFALSGLAYSIYNLVIISLHGQNLAKKILGMRIVRLHPAGQNPGFLRAVVMRMFVNGLIGFVFSFFGLIPILSPVLNSIYFLIDSCFIFGRERRCLHDLLAGTCVVDV